MPNEVEFRRWNDAEMVANWPRRERFTDAVIRHVIGALEPRPGERVLDVGSGGGKLSIEIGEAVQPGGKVVGADISKGMVEWASRRAAESGRKNISFGQYDVQSEKIPGEPFDAMTSQFGVMFFEDPVVAFSNIRRQLRPSGRIAFACWQAPAKNTWFLGRALAPFVPPPPPPQPGKSATGPFAFGDPRLVRRILVEAGFVGIQRTAKRLIVVAPTESIADDTMLASVPAERRDEARAAMERHFAQFLRPDGLCRFELGVHIFQARNAS